MSSIGAPKEKNRVRRALDGDGRVARRIVEECELTERFTAAKIARDFAHSFDMNVKKPIGDEIKRIADAAAAKLAAEEAAN